MAFTQVSAQNAWYEDQALTASAPSASTDGVPLDGLKALTVIVEANSGQTLSGGSLICNIYDPVVAGWSRAITLTFSVDPASGIRRTVAGIDPNGLQDGIGGGFQVPVKGHRPGARISFTTSSVTVSGGTTVRVYILGGT